MAKSKTDKKKQKRKAKKKQFKAAKSQQASIKNGWLYVGDASYYLEAGNMPKALKSIQKAVKILPNEEDVFHLMGNIGASSGNKNLELEAMAGLERIGKLRDDMKIDRVHILFNLQRYEECSEKADNLLENFTRVKIKDKRKTKQTIESIKAHCLFIIQKQEKQKIFHKNSAYSRRALLEKSKKATLKNHGKVAYDSNAAPDSASASASASGSVPVSASGSGFSSISGSNSNLSSKSEPNDKETPQTQPQQPQGLQHPQHSMVTQVPITYKIDVEPFLKALSNPEPADPEMYELALTSHEIRFTESFETLICLPFLTLIKSFWFQEETAKKVLKQFRGRALLSDEVGLGKTIEALIVLTEYIKRNMVKTCLILTPTPLVSQWKEEMKSKFNMDVPSTDDAGYKSGLKKFWKEPFVIASINYAKSKKNFDFITAREYDMVIVDEAHHLKNRTTLNWKLVNSLKKRFILLLTATPVENNLMELYNLITLLKPGQLETATSFKTKFMKRGNPTDPMNKALLRELLSQVMIRNTRALAGINIPPRFAETIRIEPTKAEQAFYERLEALILSLNGKKHGENYDNNHVKNHIKNYERNNTVSRMAVMNLLAQAGSSPKAVELSLSRMLEKKTYLPEHEREIMAVKNLCRTTLNTTKNKALLKLVRTTEEKIIVFVKFKGTVEHLAEFLEWNNISFSLFHGAMTNKQKDAAIEAFQNKIQVLITTEIGGEGRNLQFCSRMINYDLPWNPMKIEQRIGRIHRIGQENEVQIFNFCAAGSIEDYILDILDRKINMFEMVIGEIDMILGRIKGEKEFSDMVYDIWINSKNKEERKKAFTNLGTKMKRAKTGYNKSRELDDKLFGDTYEL